jgi:hypothetical protein
MSCFINAYLIVAFPTLEASDATTEIKPPLLIDAGVLDKTRE